MNYKVNLPAFKENIQSLSFYGRNEQEELSITNKYFTKNQKPWFPVMGEFHFSRFEYEYWEEEILKMKAGGIEIIASYIFWIHHEEMESAFDFLGNKNLHQFIILCKKHKMYLLLRIGPWSHGECRNGGFPDWLLHKGLALRTNDAAYLSYTKRFYAEIYKQAEGLLFENNGPVIGVQIENEYAHACGGLKGEQGKAHMNALKAMAIEIGFHVPYYTATGWGGAVVGDMLPVLGAYVDAPWDSSCNALPANENFLFSTLLNDKNIGSDLKISEEDIFTYDISAYPFLTAELGGGLQVTKHRRTVAAAKDTEGMIYAKLGSGANLIGYYMYHGGTNPIGKLSTMQESKKTGYNNDLPVLSYDFQAVIKEYGQRNDSFQPLKVLHAFLKDFGSDLAVTDCFIPEDNSKNAENTTDLRYSIRYGKQGSFLFINNYQRHRHMTDKKDIIIAIDDIVFPPLHIKPGEMMVYPFHWEVCGIKIDYITAQPLMKLNEKQIIFWTYSDSAELLCNHEKYTVKTGESVTINEIAITVVDRNTALNSNKITVNGIEKNIISDDLILADNEKIYKISKSAPEAVDFALIKEKENGDRVYIINLPGIFTSDENDGFLTLDFDGDIANFYLNGVLSADWFYTGIPFEIGLKKFKDKINENTEITLVIKPLYENQAVYLENKLYYNNGVACQLNKAEIYREYKKIYEIT